MKKYRTSIAALAIAGLAGCTSLSEGQGTPPPPDLNRRVRYSGDPNASLRERMDEQASEINRKHNIEAMDPNNPATTPPRQRPQQLPVITSDTVNHNVQRPLNTTVPALPATPPAVPVQVPPGG